MKFGPEEGENVAKVAGWRRYAREPREYRESDPAALAIHSLPLRFRLQAYRAGGSPRRHEVHEEKG
jgi:hypothetical protein